MSDGITAKLDRLLALAGAVGYAGGMPRELVFAELEEFTRLHAEISGLAEAGTRLAAVLNERDEARRDVRDVNEDREAGVVVIERLIKEREEARDRGRQLYRLIGSLPFDEYRIKPDADEIVAGALWIQEESDADPR